MPKSLNRQMLDVQTLISLIGLRSGDVGHITIYTNDVLISLNRAAFVRAVKRLKIRFDDIQHVPFNDKMRLEFRYLGADIYHAAKMGPDFYSLLDLVDWDPPASKPKPQAKPRAKVQPKPKPAPTRPQPTIPRSASEARDFIYRHFHLPTWPGDREFLEHARRGQIKYHPDRPSGDGHLARVFNSCVSLLKEAMA